MNPKIKNVIIFLSGAGIGSLGTWFAVKKYYEEIANREIKSVRKAFDERITKYEPVKSSIDEPDVKPDKVHLDENKSSITEKLNNKPPFTAYSTFYKRKNDNNELNLKEITRDPGEVDPAEAGSPTEDESYDDENTNETLEAEDERLNGTHKKALAENLPPFVIDKSQFELECTNYDKISLLYYVYDDILVNDSNEELDNNEVFDVVKSSGFADDDEDTMYIRDDKQMCDYEVTKIYTEFGG